VPTNSPTYWDKAFQFILDNVAPNPANFCCGIQEKVPPSLLSAVDDIFGGLLLAYEEGSKRYEGRPTQDWNARGFVFLWLLSHIEMLLLGPQKERSETISECVARRLQQFRDGRSEHLWLETRQVKSRPPGSHVPTADQIDKSVQNAADKDNYRTTFARAVKQQNVANISSVNCKYVTNKYPRCISCGFGRAATFISAQADPLSARFCPRECLVTS